MLKIESKIDWLIIFISGSLALLGAVLYATYCEKPHAIR